VTSPRRAGGFTLIEVIVAFVMLSLVLATAFEVFSRGLARAGELDDYSKALVIAQSKLAAAGIEQTIAEGETRGQSDDGRFEWVVSVVRTEEGVPPGQPPPTIYSLYRIDVRVAWTGGDTRPHAVDLSTLYLWPRPT
jgi:general secretion pathway protein I